MFVCSLFSNGRLSFASIWPFESPPPGMRAPGFKKFPKIHARAYVDWFLNRHTGILIVPFENGAYFLLLKRLLPCRRGPFSIPSLNRFQSAPCMQSSFGSQRHGVHSVTFMCARGPAGRLPFRGRVIITKRFLDFETLKSTIFLENNDHDE